MHQKGSEHHFTSGKTQNGKSARASIVTERSEARKPFGKRFSDVVGPKTPNFTQKFLIWTTSGDDVITTDKTSKALAAFRCHDIKK